MRKGLRRTAVALLLAALVLAPVAAALLALERRPLVVAEGPPDAEAVARTRDLASRLRDLVASDGAAGRFSVAEAELDAALASARRIVPGLAGRARIADGEVVLEFTAGAPRLPEGLWLNLRLAAQASEQGLELSSARLGRLWVPPALALAAARLAVDRVLGDGLGGAALATVGALRVSPGQATVLLAEPERVAFFDKLRNRVRASSGDSERIEAHIRRLDRFGDRGRLPDAGTLMPYLTHAVAASEARPDPRGELKAAILALAIYCGDRRVASAVGAWLPHRMRNGDNHCEGTTLGGRDDLKRHFVISAGIYAASTDDAVLGMGELKELLDSNAGGSGFSFDDMAANLAGARFAETFLAAPPARWRGMLARLDGEADVLPDLAGLPAGLGAAEFRARYGDVDDPAYAALIAEIGQRIDRLPLHRHRPPA